MKIIKLIARNIKKIRAVEIEPDGDLVVISGKNGQGKTSVLDSIWLALAGGDASKAVRRVIRDGENEAVAEMDIGQYVVTRKWARDKSGGETTKLAIKTADGSPVASPQKTLDGLIGSLSFDPLAFMRLGEKDQVVELIRATGSADTLRGLDEKRGMLYAARTDANRDAKAAKARCINANDIPKDAPDEEVSHAEILAKIEAAQTIEREKDRLRRTIEIINLEGMGIADELAELRRQTQIKVDQAREIEKRREVARLAYESAPIPAENIDALKSKLFDIDAINMHVRAKKENAKWSEAAAQAEKESARLTAEIDAIDAEKKALVSGPSMPVDGLAIDDFGVTFGGVALSDCSGAERLKVAVGIAMALNPTLRILRITDGSLLDTENLAALAEMAKASDYQIWIERVEEDSAALVIEDGRGTPMTIHIPQMGEKSEMKKEIGQYHWMIYGDGGVGKTSLAAEFPRALFLATERGQAAIEKEIVEIASWKDLTEFSEKFPNVNKLPAYQYQTIVIDTLDRLYDCALDAMIASTSDGKLTAQNQQSVWGRTNTSLRLLISGLQSSGCALVFLTHYRQEIYDAAREKRKKDRPGGAEDYCFSVAETFGSQTFAFVDFCVFLANENGRRTIRTASGPGYRAKSRIALPAEIPMGANAREAYAALKRAFDAAIAARQNGTVATPENKPTRQDEAPKPAKKAAPVQKPGCITTRQAVELHHALMGNEIAAADWLAEEGYEGLMDIPADAYDAILSRYVRIGA